MHDDIIATDRVTGSEGLTERGWKRYELVWSPHVRKYKMTMIGRAVQCGSISHCCYYNA